jgi:hypothetical protein
MPFSDKEFGKGPTRFLVENPFVMSTEEQGIAPHPGHLFKLLKGTNFLLLTGGYFLLLG